MTALVLAEHDNQKVAPNTFSAIAAAKQFAGKITILVAGFKCDAVIQELSCINDIAEICFVDALAYSHALAEPMTELIVNFLKNSDDVHFLIAPASTFGKNIIPRVGALLDVSPISDVVNIIDDKTFVRPIYAGNALATIESYDSIKLLTVRTSAFTLPTTEINNEPHTDVTLQHYLLSHRSLPFCRRVIQKYLKI